MIRTRLVVPVVALASLAAPAGASAHSRSTTVALDYRLVLDRQAPLPGVNVAILDGDRDLRISSPRTAVVVLGDLGEPMLRIGPAGTWVNRGSITAAAERLTTSGHGWTRLTSSSSFAWHEHRLSPPPYDASRLGAVARFDIPLRGGDRRIAVAGTFVRVRRPSMWPWVAAVAAVVALAAALAMLRPNLRRQAGIAFGCAAVATTLALLVVFGAADAPSGRVQWLQLVLAGVIAAAAFGVVVRLRGARRAHFAGLLGGVSAAVSAGSFAVFLHGAVVSVASAAVSRALVAGAFAAGIAGALTGLFADEGS